MTHDFEEALKHITHAKEVDEAYAEIFEDEIKAIQLALRIADRLQKGDVVERLGVISSDLSNRHCPQSHIDELQEIYNELNSIIN